MKNTIEVGGTYKNKNGQKVEIVYKRELYEFPYIFPYIGIVEGKLIQSYCKLGISFMDSDIVFEAEYELRDTLILKDGRKVVITQKEPTCLGFAEVGKSGSFYIHGDTVEIARKATKEEAECPYQDGELCLVRFRPQLDWNLRFSNGAGEFYTDQNIGGYTVLFEEHKSAYPLTELPESEL